MLVAIPLSYDERAAVDDGQEACSDGWLISPPPAGPTPAYRISAIAA